MPVHFGAATLIVGGPDTSPPGWGRAHRAFNAVAAERGFPGHLGDLDIRIIGDMLCS